MAFPGMTVTLVDKDGTPIDATGGLLKVSADLVVGDTVEVSNATVAKAVSARLSDGTNLIDGTHPLPVAGAITGSVTATCSGTVAVSALPGSPAQEHTAANSPASVRLSVDGTNFNDSTHPHYASITATVPRTVIPYKSWVDGLHGAGANWKTAADPTVTDAGDGAILTAAFLAGAMRYYVLPAGKESHQIAIGAPGNSADFDAIYDVYEVHVLPVSPATTLNDWLSIGIKCVDGLRIARAEANSQAQIVIQSQALGLLFVLRSVATAPNPTGQCRVLSW